jgi:hypothetical protein
MEGQYMERRQEETRQRENNLSGKRETARQEGTNRGLGLRHGVGPPAEEDDKILKILYTNAQSIYSKLGELEILADEVKPDFILLTETWCNNTTVDASLYIQNYSLETELRRDRTDTGRGVGGGLLVYVRDPLQILRLQPTLQIWSGELTK